MVKKLLYICEVFIIGVILFVAGHLFSFSENPPYAFEISLFELQEKYSEKIQNDLEEFIEPIVGPGNVKAFVQIQLTDKITQTHPFPKTPHPNQMMIKNSERGIVLVRQNISLIINTTSSVSQNIFQDLISNALGIQSEKGDTLSIQILPFKEIAPLTFGLSRLTLVRMAGILMILLFGSFVLLMILYFKENKSKEIPLLTGQIATEKPKENLFDWAYFTSLSEAQLKILLSYISKGILIYALQIAPLKIHQMIAKVIPPSIWNELLNLYKQTPYSYSKSLKAQQEIEKTYKELIQKNIL